MDLHTCVFECNWFNYWSPWPLTPIKCGPSVNLAPLRRTLCGCGGDWGRCVFVRRCKDVSAGDWNCLLSLSVRWLLSLKLFSSVSYYTSCDNTPPHPHTHTHAYAQPYRHGRFHVHVHTQSIYIMMSPLIWDDKVGVLLQTCTTSQLHFLHYIYKNNQYCT